MKEMKSYTIADVCSRLSSGKGIPTSKVTTTGLYPVIGGNGVRGYTDSYNFDGECAVIGRQGANCGNVRYFQGKAYMTEHAIVAIGNESANTKYLACLFSLMHLGNLSAQSAQPGLSVQTLSKQPVSLPDIKTQDQIADIIIALDTKIELNRQINDNLEQQAQALFNYYFVDNINELGEYSEGALTDVASYLNGLAMQKFRPGGTDCGLPVLKIKELGQGFCDSNSDRCSSYIKNDYLIDNGEIIFSWSGTLMVDFWCSGKCGLNQHLFKVTSDEYPKWFIYFWTKHHLDQFIRIANDKAVTMGHIKRTELDNANVLIPSAEKIGQIGATIAPMIDQLINNRVEMMELSSLRDSLLPKLMSGELKINNLDC